MAERRMFAKAIINSDAFIDMSISARCLYFYLMASADDDGFVCAVKATIRSANCSDDDLKLLIAKGFVIPFESGVIVIRHWKQHNYIQKDRYRPTTYKREIGQLTLENGVYNLCIQNVSKVDTECIQTGYNMDTQVSQELVGDSQGKLSISTYCAEPETDSTPAVIELILNDKTFYPIYQTDIDEWSECFLGVDVMQELRKMKSWSHDNPTRRKTRRGIRRFISSWLSRAQDMGGARNSGTNTTGSSANDYSMSYRPWD